jgi:hypothetical protein
VRKLEKESNKVFFVTGSVLKYEESTRIVPRKLLKGLKISKRGIQAFRTFECADDLVLLAKEETAVQDVKLKLEDAMGWKRMWKKIKVIS